MKRGNISSGGAAALVSVLMIAACGGQSSESPATACVPGEARDCPTADGCRGMQICDDLGERYSPCECLGRADGGNAGAGGESSSAGSGAGGSTSGDGGAPDGGSTSGGGATVGGASAGGTDAGISGGGSAAGGGVGGTAAVDAGLTVPVCGNGVREASEECDGTDLSEARCGIVTSGLAWEGSLACRPDCTFDTQACTAATGTCPSISDGVCDEPTTCPTGTDGDDCCVTESYYCGNESNTCIAVGCIEIVNCALSVPCFGLEQCYQPQACQPVIDSLGGLTSPAARAYDDVTTCYRACP